MRYKLIYSENKLNEFIDRLPEFDYVIEDNGSLDELVKNIKQILIKEKLLV